MVLGASILALGGYDFNFVLLPLLIASAGIISAINADFNLDTQTGKLLDNMADSQYRLTASNIEIAQKGNSPKQVIKFISYAYFQTALKKKYTAETVTPKTKITKPVLVAMIKYFK